MKAELLRIVDETDRVRRFFFKAKDRESLEFQAGQFVTLYLPQLPEFANSRSYSIASSPFEVHEFELCISLNPEGSATPILWNLTVGEILEMSEPQGNFMLRDHKELDVVFICTGTGVAPFRSMIQFLLKNEPQQKMTLIFGNRWQKDILYHQEFLNIEAANPQFTYIPVLSKEAQWDGHKGYVHAVYQSLYSDGREARFYVCGWQEMCREARQNLKMLGYNRQQYFFEQYD